MNLQHNRDSTDMGPFSIDQPIIKNLTFFALGGVVFFTRQYIASMAWAVALRGRPEPIFALLTLSLGVAIVLIAPIPKVEFYLTTLIAWVFILSAACIGFPLFLTNRITINIGQISYSIYLIHPLVIVGLIKFNVFPMIYTLSPSSAVCFLLSFTLTFGLTLLLGAISYRVIEVPGQNWGKSFMKRYSV